MAVVFCCACSPKPEKTIENLKNIAVSEQNAVFRYRAYSAKAREEGYHNIKNLFEAIAHSEEIHTEYPRRLMSEYGEKLGIVTDSTSQVQSTHDNLKVAVREELYEFKTAFPIFAAVAGTEGASEIELFLQWMTAIAWRHEEYCRKALEKLETENSDWNVANSWSVCPQCGCLYMTASLNEVCDLCETPASSFILYQ